MSSENLGDNPAPESLGATSSYGSPERGSQRITWKHGALYLGVGIACITAGIFSAEIIAGALLGGTPQGIFVDIPIEREWLQAEFLMLGGGLGVFSSLAISRRLEHLFLN